MPGEAVLTGLSPAEIVMPGEMEMDHAGDMRGFMPLVGSRGNLTFSFTVPDKPGEWIYGCFQQSGQHFLNGMKGTVTILPKSALAGRGTRHNGPATDRAMVSRKTRSAVIRLAVLWVAISVVADPATDRNSA